MKIATWNVNSLSVRLPQVLDWLAANPTDVLALQELKLTDDKFPIAAFQELGDRNKPRVGRDDQRHGPSRAACGKIGDCLSPSPCPP